MNEPVIGVLGAGSWGVALAQLCAGKGLETRLWARRDRVAEQIMHEHRSDYLPGIALDPALQASSDMGSLANADIVLVVVPAQSARSVMTEAARFLRPDAALVLCQKGVERETLMLPDAIARETVPGNPVAVLTGPSFSADVAAGLPTAVTVASEDKALAEYLQAALATPVFRPYPSDDIIGAQVGGAIKNVLAIACGIVVARGLGESARAALIARGFAEMVRLATAMGGRMETVAGLSGLGDLALTCASSQSRNFALGLRIGQGSEESTGKTCEGAATAQAAVDLAARWGVDCPICETVSDIVAGRSTVENAVDALMQRPLKSGE